MSTGQIRLNKINRLNYPSKVFPILLSTWRVFVKLKIWELTWTDLALVKRNVLSPSHRAHKTQLVMFNFWSQEKNRPLQWQAPTKPCRYPKLLDRDSTVGATRSIICWAHHALVLSPSHRAWSTSRCGASWPDERWKIARRCGAKHISKSKVWKLAVSDHFWKLRCRKSARPCGAKHISKSKCTKHTILGPLLEVEMSKKCTPLWREAHFEVKMYMEIYPKHLSVGPLLEVEMSKKCTPLWREAHFEVKMYKTHHARTTFGGSDVEKVHAVVARSTCPSQKCKKLKVLSRFWR